MISKVESNNRSPIADQSPDASSVDSAPKAEEVAPAFPIVGIGASAGGLEAFTQILASLAPQTGMAFVLIQHLDPTHPSQLTELLGKATCLPVVEIADGMEVAPDHVYVIPPNANLTIAKGVLHLSPRGDARQQHLPLDSFFRSLAEDRHSRAIGVILSGTGSDGSRGLIDIKAAGGITFAQNAESAKFPAMPLNATSAGGVDYVLPPAEIAVELARIAAHTYFGDVQAPADTQALAQILGHLKSHAGVDFSHYRSTTIQRRVARRMALCRRNGFAEYVPFLQQNSTEAEALFQDILIHVTSFFRDASVFAALKEVVFPRILDGKSPDTPIRLWVPGCSTGQEAYSLAIVLLEYLEQRSVRPPIQIFATDISDTAAIDKARAGLYPLTIESEVSPERLARFFTRESNGFRVGKLVRDTCTFARQNIITDPPFSKLDMISCRNLLIYLTAPLQQRLIPVFHYALNPDGFLLLGSSETVGRFSDLFAPADKKHNIYRRQATAGRFYPPVMGGDSPGYVSPPPGIPGERAPNIGDIQKEADRLVLGHYTPAGVIINEDMQILQFRGRTGPYLEPPPGEANYNLLKMARENLFVELRSAIEEAKKRNVKVRREGVQIREGMALRSIDLEVIPIRPSVSGVRCFLVLFVELGGGRGGISPPAASDLQHSGATSPNENETTQLHQELAATKEYMQGVIDRQGVTNEELQAANEEIRSTNEELQSTNEEMQTAKEELQSTNEELRTVNDELKSRNGEISILSDDLANTLGSIKLPVVLLGHDLRIRRFTPIAEKLLNMIPSDIGRPFRDITSTLVVPDLENLLREVIATAVGHEQKVQDRNGRWYLLRLHPYRTADRRIDGVVLVLLDIDEGERSRLKLGFANTELENRVELRTNELSASNIRLKAQGDEVTRLESQVAFLIDEERINLGMEMHDNLCQQLSASRMLSSSLFDQMKEQGTPLAEQAERIAEALGRAENDAHRMAKGLLPVPVNAQGLMTALSQLMNQTRESAHIACEFECSEEVRCHNNSIATHLFRITQEAVQNAVKHARATHIFVELTGHDHLVTLSICDDGVGIPPISTRTAGNGLRSMEYRARLIGADLSVSLAEGGGTIVRCVVPEGANP
jgi:two-component system CheB/CheR fusion protein